MHLTLDHLLIAVRDLDAAARNYRRLFGRRPSWRGRHPTYGTANVLFRLDNTYVELLAPGDESDHPWRRALLEHLDARGEGLYALALGTDDLDATVDAARRHGLDVKDPADGDGVDLDTGARRAWRNARIHPDSTRGVRAFFIQHRSPPDALPPAQLDDGAASTVNAVDHTVIISSDLDASLSLWRDVLGLDLRRTVTWPPQGGPDARQLNFLRIGPPGATTSSIIELAGAAPPRPATADPRPAAEGRDTLYGVSYRAPDVAALARRLRDSGVDISDPRFGRADDTVVADLKPGFSHDVRTLFIQKDVP